MFTEYHLEKIIQAINDAEERQTKSIVAAIESIGKQKPKPIFISTPSGLEGWLCGKPEDNQGKPVYKEDFDPDKVDPETLVQKTLALQDEIEKEMGKTPSVPSKILSPKKPTTPKKPVSKKPAPVRGRN